MSDATEFQKAYLEHQKKLQRDIRPMIARSGQYNPEGDVPNEYQRYPLMVRIGDKDIKVYSEEEENKVLGIIAKPAKKVDVDIANIPQPAEVHVKRKYTKRAQAADLPATLT